MSEDLHASVGPGLALPACESYRVCVAVPGFNDRRDGTVICAALALKCSSYCAANEPVVRVRDQVSW